jgi:hypothetical protein
VVHPIHVAPTLRERWAERLAEYELLPPFPQLAREVFPGETWPTIPTQPVTLRGEDAIAAVAEVGWRGLDRVAGGAPTKLRLAWPLPIEVMLFARAPTPQVLELWGLTVGRRAPDPLVVAPAVARSELARALAPLFHGG